uniref:Ubiquitin-like domain-containing protein n=1 Tax=Tetraselmis sp. GSL018 TaxID=582737 RepID=A0A061R1D7_9CHLO
MPDERTLNVRINHHSTIESRDNDRYVTVTIAGDGSDTISELKSKISEAICNGIPPSEIKVTFGPCDVHIGQEYIGDPYIDESKLKISQFSFLQWLEKFPDWYLTAKALPPPPPPPGVADGCFVG